MGIQGNFVLCNADMNESDMRCFEHSICIQWSSGIDEVWLCTFSAIVRLSHLTVCITDRCTFRRWSVDRPIVQLIIKGTSNSVLLASNLSIDIDLFTRSLSIGEMRFEILFITLTEYDDM